MEVSEKEGILKYFSDLGEENPDMSAAVAAIKTLLHYLENNRLETLAGLRAKLKDAIATLTQTDSSVTSVSSGCDLFLRFITLTSLEHSSFEKCQKIMLERGNLFLEKVAVSRQKIAKLAQQFIRDGSNRKTYDFETLPEASVNGALQSLYYHDPQMTLTYFMARSAEFAYPRSQTILVHSHSRVVQQVLREAAYSKKRFKVYVTESRPNNSGFQTHKELTEFGIPTTVILDAAVGYVMEKIDMVLCGAEGVVESGGIINKIGTYTISISAKAMNKPFYVVAESFKFARFYPLNQQDVPNEFKYKASTLKTNKDLSQEHPLVDYTPPAYITLLFTDLGVLTPSAISDELIKLYC